MSPTMLCDEFAAAAMALNEAMYIQTSGRPENAAPSKSSACLVVSSCEYCWRTGFRGYKNRFYCQFHRPGPRNTAYKSAKQLLFWNPPDQLDEGRRPFLALMRRKARGKINSGLAGWDEVRSVIMELCTGDPDSLDRIEEHTVDLDLAWGSLEYLRAFIRAKQKQPHMDCPRSLVSALDPIGSAHRTIHKAFHEACVRDQRLLLDMMQTAEAWIEADAVRRSYQGGGRNPNVERKHVGPRPPRPNVPVRSRVAYSSVHSKEDATDSDTPL